MYAVVMATWTPWTCRQEYLVSGGSQLFGCSRCDVLDSGSACGDFLQQAHLGEDIVEQLKVGKGFSLQIVALCGTAWPKNEFNYQTGVYIWGQRLSDKNVNMEVSNGLGQSNS
eukprot:3604817-Pyramimonas_sp.AAC.1